MRRAIRWLFGALGYWTLFSGAVLLFACAVLVPEWRDYEGLRRQRGELTAYREKLRGDLDQLRRAEAALPADAAINERLARLQLGYRSPGEVGVWVPEPMWCPAATVGPRRTGELSEAYGPALGPLMVAAGKARSRKLMLLIAAGMLVGAVGIGLLAGSRKKPQRPLVA